MGDRWPWANPPTSVTDRTGGTYLDAKLVSPSTVAWADQRGDLFTSAPDGSGMRALVTGTGTNSIISFAWDSANGDSTYLMNTPTALEWHLVRAGLDQVVASTTRIGPSDGRPIATPLMVAFSGDFQFLAIAGDMATFQIRRWNGSALATGASIVPTSTLVSDLLWAGSSLYFRDDYGIEDWTEAGSCSALPGVQWIRPKLSPDGQRIVFYTEDSSGLDHVYLYDLSTRKVTQLSPAGGAEAWFLGSRNVWFLEQRLCAAGEPCGVGRATFTGKTYIVDLQTGEISQSRIVRIADTWPRPGQPNFDNFWWMDASAYPRSF